MEIEHDILVNFDSPCGVFTLTFDDNGRVAYAYLKQGNVILGDVWVYNRCIAPDQPAWNDRTKLPFANPKEYTNPIMHIEKPKDIDDLVVYWKYTRDHPTAFICIRGQLVATVGVGDKPGCSWFAGKDGPLAKQLDISTDAG